MKKMDHHEEAIRWTTVYNTAERALAMAQARQKRNARKDTDLAEIIRILKHRVRLEAKNADR